MSSASTQYCPNCGASNPIDAQSCWNCGQALPTSDERQELWSTREAETDRDAARGNEPADPAGPLGDRSGNAGAWSGAATEPFQTPAGGNRSGDTRTYPTTWGAPDPDSTGPQWAGSSGDVPAAGQPAASTPANDYGYRAGATSVAPPGSGDDGQGFPDYGPGGYGQGEAAPAGGTQPGYGPASYGRNVYPSWNPAPAPAGDYAAGQPASPYGPGDGPRQPYAQTDYGVAPYDQQPAYGVGPGGFGPGGPVLALPVGPRGPSGCLLGVLGVVLIALVGAVLVAIVAYNAATGDQLRDGLRDVAATEVTRTGPVEIPEDGRLTVGEADVNRTIRRYTDNYGAISDPTLAINPDGVVLNFSVLGIDSAYRSGLVAEGGQLRLTDPRASGAASRVLGADDMAAIVEPALNDILRQSGVTATGVELGDGELTVLTAGNGVTPVAGTPAATPVTAPASTAPNIAGSATPASSGPAAPPSAAPGKPGGGFIGIFGDASGSPSPSGATGAGAQGGSAAPSAPPTPAASGSMRTDIG